MIVQFWLARRFKEPEIGLDKLLSANEISSPAKLPLLGPWARHLTIQPRNPQAIFFS